MSKENIRTISPSSDMRGRGGVKKCRVKMTGKD